MRDDRRQGRGESCPWCGTPVADRQDPVVVRPDRPQVPDQVLHRDCASEWESFVERARAVATRGARHPLVDAPLEREFEIDERDDATR